MAKNKLPVQKLSAKAKAAVPVKIVSDSPMESTAERRNWRAEDALRDIERAEAHKSDKSLMSDVKKLAQDKLAALKKIC
jgi:hypothetical protein